MSVKTLANWVAKAKREQLPVKRRAVGPVDDVQAELARLRQEVVTLRTEKEILKKAAAYFARESL
jgi:transposase